MYAGIDDAGIHISMHEGMNVCRDKMHAGIDDARIEYVCAGTDIYRNRWHMNKYMQE